MNSTWQALVGLFPELAFEPRVTDTLRRHAALVETLGARSNLTAVTGAEAVMRHYGESLELWRIAIASGGSPHTLVDIGSGAGYPGMVLAAIAPDCRVILIEPRQKRAAALETMTRELGLANVEVLAARAEDAGRGELRASAALVTARAVAALPVLLEYAAPFAQEGGLLAFPKGSGGSDELSDAAPAAIQLGCTYLETVPMRPDISGTIQVIIYRQDSPIPERFPRRAGIPARRPLGVRRTTDDGERKT